MRWLRPISAYNISTVRASEKTSTIANRKSATRFPTSYRWSPYVTPKSTKGLLKMNDYSSCCHLSSVFKVCGCIVCNKCNNSLQLWGSPNTVVFWHQQWLGRCSLSPKIWPTPFNGEMTVIILFHWNIDVRNWWFQWLSAMMLSLWSSGRGFNSRLSKLFFIIFLTTAALSS